MIMFSLGGTSFGMWEETMAFYPLLIPVFAAAGYDPLVGIAVVLMNQVAAATRISSRNRMVYAVGIRNFFFMANQSSIPC